ncbi:DUF4214 domain-containing protein [Zemynaea arenosa]|nr:DUF4214 domain-containing protein [Massilia arenosa]
MTFLTRSLLAACIAATLAPAASATGIFLAPLSKWKDGKITWYYNPQYTPAEIGDEYFLAATKEAMAKWSKGCNIKVEYGGLTTVAPDPRNWIPSNQVTVGFFPFVNDNVAGRGGLANPALQGFATSGLVALNMGDPIGRTHLERGEAFKEVLTHEIGHMLGLGHTLNPYSIMYGQTSGGINSWKSDPFGEDYTTCANLYGSKGLVERPYYGGDVTPDSSYGISVAFETSMPDPLKPQSPAIEVLDLSVPDRMLYKVLRAPKGADASQVQWRLVAPNGDLVDPLHYSLEADRAQVIQNSGMTWMSTVLPTARNMSSNFLPAVNGHWRLQAFVGDKPAAEFKFETINGGIAPDERFLEMALIAEVLGDRIHVSTAHLDQLGLARVDTYLNGDHATSASDFLLPKGPSTIELWGKSDLPRPSQCIPQDTPDVVRYLSFGGTTGQLADNRIAVVESGNLQAYSASATVETARSGTQQVFVAAYAGGATLYRQADGSWAPEEHALFSFNAPGAANFDVVRNLNSYTMPANAQIVVAYGASLADAVARKQTALVHTFSNGSAAAESMLADYRDNYTLSMQGGVVTVTRKSDGKVMQYSVAQDIGFLDRKVSFDIDGAAGQLYRLYQATFNRKPDAEGLGYWLGRMQQGLSLQGVSSSFQESPEFQKLYGAGVSNEAWLRTVYQNVLHRAPDADGLAWWVAKLDSGAARVDVLIGFSEDTENRKNVAAGYANGVEYVPYAQ